MLPLSFNGPRIHSLNQSTFMTKPSTFALKKETFDANFRYFVRPAEQLLTVSDMLLHSLGHVKALIHSFSGQLVRRWRPPWRLARQLERRILRWHCSLGLERKCFDSGRILGNKGSRKIRAVLGVFWSSDFMYVSH